MSLWIQAEINYFNYCKLNILLQSLNAESSEHPARFSIGGDFHQYDYTSILGNTQNYY